MTHDKDNKGHNTTRKEESEAAKNRPHSAHTHTHTPVKMEIG